MDAVNGANVNQQIPLDNPQAVANLPVGQQMELLEMQAGAVIHATQPLMVYLAPDAWTGSVLREFKHRMVYDMASGTSQALQVEGAQGPVPLSQGLSSGVLKVLNVANRGSMWGLFEPMVHDYSQGVGTWLYGAVKSVMSQGHRALRAVKLPLPTADSLNARVAPRMATYGLGALQLAQQGTSLMANPTAFGQGVVFGYLLQEVREARKYEAHLQARQEAERTGQLLPADFAVHLNPAVRTEMEIEQEMLQDPQANKAGLLVAKALELALPYAGGALVNVAGGEVERTLRQAKVAASFGLGFRQPSLTIDLAAETAPQVAPQLGRTIANLPGWYPLAFKNGVEAGRYLHQKTNGAVNALVTDPGKNVKVKIGCMVGLGGAGLYLYSNVGYYFAANFIAPMALNIAAATVASIPYGATLLTDKAIDVIAKDRQEGTIAKVAKVASRGGIAYLTYSALTSSIAQSFMSNHDYIAKAGFFVGAQVYANMATRTVSARVSNEHKPLVQMLGHVAGLIGGLALSYFMMPTPAVV